MRKARLYAEEHVAADLGLSEQEVRAYTLSTAPREFRRARPQVDWMHIDAVAFRAVGKVAMRLESSRAQAAEDLMECYVGHFHDYEEDEDGV